MKKTTKIISALLSLTMVVTLFAACGKSGEEPTTTEPIQSEVNNPIEENTAEAQDSTDAEAVTNENGEQTTGTGDTADVNSKPAAEVTSKNGGTVSVKKPSSREELISAYNSAIKAKKLNCTSVRQRVASGTIGTKDKVVIDFSDPKYTTVDTEIAFRETFERNDKNGTALSALSSADINSATVSGNTVTFKLKNCSASESLSGGTHGYINVVDAARAEKIGLAVKNAVPDAPGSVKLKSASFGLSNGVITAEFNDDFTQLKSVKFSCAESVNAKFSYLVLTIIADLRYNVTSEYK